MRLHPVGGLEHLQDVGAALVPPVGGVHRVDRHVAAGVGGEPVVGEHAVRAGVVVVGEDVDPYPGRPQRLGDRVHLGQRPGRGLVVGLPRRDVDWKALSAAVCGFGTKRSARMRMTEEGAWALTPEI